MTGRLDPTVIAAATASPSPGNQRRFGESILFNYKIYFSVCR